ncbi:hypothetical protein [Pseudodesulfovibrio sp. zrk46]|uniref:hypothetical protein n=1 Tax=Pseudodesulfovibrio sp. zrk46 TaxID=2725288 RepID=UPI001448E67C|nr:hypothetical protein [Pseudodesulfovibrio sp. zrk46]QJB55169.1 hypothetical protein HFN16_01570 [Pseudodesulfovibrio sp. zrk46]
MHDIREVEQSILRMTAVIRQELARDVARSFGEEPDPEVRPMGWWVLACGEELDEDSEKQREEARERLLYEVRMAGLVLPENIWVWDDTAMAQLVISTVPTLKRAEKLARHLRSKGLTIRIRREKI